MREPIRGLVVCVGYDDLLSITLPRNARHMSEVYVVTAPLDHRTREVCSKVPSVKVFETDAFYRHGAKFNKGLAIEECFDFMGRTGWILVHDADILMPEVMPLPELRIGNLYTPPRRILEDVKRWRPDFAWRTAPVRHELNKLFPGYFHLFNAADPALDPLPWYDVTSTHAGGGDGFFQSRWAFRHRNKIVLPFEVLHLGPVDANWFGRASERVDGAPVDPAAKADIDYFHQQVGWRPARVPRDPNYTDHVEVPGHKPRPWHHDRFE